MATISVRTLFDLYLQAKNFPKGSEIIMTALSIPDMVRIVEEHGLVAVPISIDPATLQPSLDQVVAATSPLTVAVIFAFVFGCTYNISPYVDFCQRNSIEMIEDVAQSFRGLEVFRGSKHAALTMFSFGMIKNPTAFSGAISIIRSSKSWWNNQGNLFEKMEKLHDNYEWYTVPTYEAKILKCFGLWAAVTNHFAIWTAMHYFAYKGIVGEDFLIDKLRGFAASQDFLGKFRQKPCAPLLAMLYTRTSTYTQKDMQTYSRNYENMATQLTAAGIFVPGCAKIGDRSYWLFQMVAGNKNQFKDFLTANGVYGYKGTTQLYIVP